jgi:phosphatidate cytidylyltransferase
MFGVIVVLMIVNAVFRYPLKLVRSGTGGEIATLGIELLIVVYVGLFLATTSRLRWPSEASSGYFALGALVVATKMGDTGAYTFGRLIGGPKMTPALSPGKTWSGGIGHLVTAMLFSVVWLCWLGPKICPLWQPWKIAPAEIFGVVVGFAGLVGDLAESLIKRDVGVKDAPALLPGFGGLLDLMDSILLAGPVAYAMWHVLR